MGFLSNLFSGREVNRLEELIQSSPAPSLFLRLAQIYRERGEEEKAREVTEHGAKMFPESEALSQAQADAERVRNEAERHRLQIKIEQYPSPMLYARLAKLYLKERGLDQAEKTCRDGIRHFPDYGGLWAGLGEVSVARRNLEDAVEHLQKAAELDKYNYNAMLMLAEVFLRRGMRDEGRQTLNRILEFSPADEKVTQFLKEFDQRAAALEKEMRAAGAAPAAASALAADAGGQNVVPRTEPINAKKISGVGTSLHVEIRQIRRVDGVRGTLLIDPAGLVIASDLPEGMEEELNAALITSICRTVRESTVSLGIGEFEDGIVDTPRGCIHILTLDQMTMGVFAAPETKAGLLQRAIHTFAERVIDAYH